MYVVMGLWGHERCRGWDGQKGKGDRWRKEENEEDKKVVQTPQRKLELHVYKHIPTCVGVLPAPNSPLYITTGPYNDLILQVIH